jgi:hypothetical protein
MKTLLASSFSLIVVFANAQTEVRMSSNSFNTGVHTTFVVDFENLDGDVLEAYWKKQLKDMSDDVSTKKHITATGVMVPTIHRDTIAVFGKAVQAKKSPNSAMHVAFRVNNEILGTGTGDSEDQRMQAAKDFVRHHSVEIKRGIAQTELDDASKALSRLEKTLEGLIREKERAENTKEKTIGKANDAKNDKSKAEGELDGLESQIKIKQAEVANNPSEGNTDDLNKLLSDKDKATNTVQKANRTIENADKKVKDLEYAIEKNIEDQANTSAEIDKQKELVELLTQKLADIK